MSNNKRRGLALADNPLDMLLPPSKEPSEVNTPDNATPAPATTHTAPEAIPTKQVAADSTEQPAVKSPTKNAARAQVKSTKVTRRTLQGEGVSASNAYRIGTIQDPYHRIDGEIVRPMRLTLPVKLIEDFQVLAIRRGLKTTALAQQLLEQFVQQHHDEL